MGCPSAAPSDPPVVSSRVSLRVCAPLVLNLLARGHSDCKNHWLQTINVLIVKGRRAPVVPHLASIAAKRAPHLPPSWGTRAPQMLLPLFVLCFLLFFVHLAPMFLPRDTPELPWGNQGTYVSHVLLQ